METKNPSLINNAFYDTLNEKWHEGEDHPVALLRAENRVRNPWILKTIEEKMGQGCSILDIGCGGGLLTNFLASHGHKVFGIDQSSKSLEVAKEKDLTKSVMYKTADAAALPFEKESFDVVSAMDLLEHVQDPSSVIKEASRILRPGGIFFFHTFNRNFLSYLLAVKGIEWFVKNSPSNLHSYSLFIKPEELKKMCAFNGLQVKYIKGLMPDIATFSFWKMLFTRTVAEDFRFVFTPSLKTGYVGYAIKIL